jgi:signal transduction histidine kinase
MTAIIRQLLDFARRRTLRPSDVELGEPVRETLALVSALAARQQVSLRHVPRGSALARVDPVQLQQVLTNLVVNAVQAMPDGGEVRIETGQEDAEGLAGAAYVRVIDRGTGIAPEALPRIFEPFFTTKDVGQGTGLGLAVAHGIVEEHGGRIEVHSELGKGSTFTVRLPGSRRQEAA